MADKFPHIFEPLTVGKITFKNRVFSAPATAHMIQDSGISKPCVSYIRHYVEKARGGLACVQCGGQMVFPAPGVSPIRTELDISDPSGWRNFRRMTDAIHFYGAKCSFEIVHFGGEGEYPWIPREEGVWGCCDFVRSDGVRFKEMPLEEMQRVAERYAELAGCIKACGFDTMFIHGGHGTLLEEYVSPRSNHRTDEFGGSMENRARFPLMVLDAIRARVGRDLLIEYRISGSECVPGGLEIDECIEFIKLIQDRIDMIHISAGIGRAPRLRGVTHPTGFLPPACNAHLARAVKQCPDVHIPVITVGAFQQPEDIEAALANGDADVVAMARGTIADPQTVNKILEGREQDIRPCIKCFHCLDQFKTAHYFSCSVNPDIGREEYECLLVPRTDDHKRVGIIGGGPAGMKAAIDAADRGYDVTLYERTGRLGGQLKDAAFMSFKYDLKKYEDYLIRQVESRSAVDVRLNTEATPDLVASEGFDVVLCAIGAEPLIPPIPGIRGEQVLWAGDAFWCAPERIGSRVVVVGGGQVGCETAIHFASQGKALTVLEMRAGLAPDAMLTYREELEGQLQDHKATVLTSCRCTGITEQGVAYVDAGGKEGFVEADTVLIAAGMRARTAQAEAFRGCAKQFRSIGDCEKVGNVEGATRTANDAVASL